MPAWGSATVVPAKAGTQVRFAVVSAQAGTQVRFAVVPA